MLFALLHMLQLIITLMLKHEIKPQLFSTNNVPTEINAVNTLSSVVYND